MANNNFLLVFRHWWTTMGAHLCIYFHHAARMCLLLDQLQRIFDWILWWKINQCGNTQLTILQILPNLWSNSFALQNFFLFVCGRPDLYSQFDQRNAFLTHIDYFDTIFMLFPIHYSIFDYSNCNFGKPGWFCFW